MKKHKGLETQERLLSTAEAMILDKGYAGMSLDALLQDTGLTKGAFFYHFKNKADLALCVLERYARNDLETFRDWNQRALRLSDDPLQQIEIFLRLFEEYLDSLNDPPPGCIFASYTHERNQFEDQVRSSIEHNLELWIGIFEERFEAVIAAYPPRLETTARTLAELLASMIEGSYVMANALNDARWNQRQLEGFRQHLKLLFAPDTRV
jgi:TetR/AcrR family transcriptional regulator, transcriptional repressor for nem operon